jgi:hypothetical protein
MVLHLSMKAAEQTGPARLMTARGAPRLVVVLAARLRWVCWPLAVLFWRLCIGRGPAAWS